jgi:hypothetical protein
MATRPNLPLKPQPANLLPMLRQAERREAQKRTANPCAHARRADFFAAGIEVCLKRRLR